MDPKIVIVITPKGVNGVRLVAPTEEKEKEILGVYSKIQGAVNKFRKNADKLLRT